ncbi:MAG: hypothetical protein R3D00_30680 [Bacteroidia bacterium]
MMHNTRIYPTRSVYFLIASYEYPPFSSDLQLSGRDMYRLPGGGNGLFCGAMLVLSEAATWFLCWALGGGLVVVVAVILF